MYRQEEDLYSFMLESLTPRCWSSVNRSLWQQSDDCFGATSVGHLQGMSSRYI